MLSISTDCIIYLSNKFVKNTKYGGPWLRFTSNYIKTQEQKQKSEID